MTWADGKTSSEWLCWQSLGKSGKRERIISEYELLIPSGCQPYLLTRFSWDFGLSDVKSGKRRSGSTEKRSQQLDEPGSSPSNAGYPEN
jgi:hypothetical protein